MMQEIDRVAAIIRPTEHMLNWINQHMEPEEKLSMLDLLIDCTVILLPTFETEDEAEEYLMTIYEDVFENELASWVDDLTLWPEDRSIETFLEWFHLEFHSTVYDAASLPEDETDGEEEGRVFFSDNTSLH